MSEIMEYTYPICKNVLLAFFRLHGCRFSNSLPLKKNHDVRFSVKNYCAYNATKLRRTCLFIENDYRQRSLI